MKFNTLPRRVAATGAVTALAAGALVGLTATAADAANVTVTYSCPNPAGGDPLAVTLDTDIPLLPVLGGQSWPAGDAVDENLASVTNHFTMPQATKDVLDGFQVSNIHFADFAGSLGSSKVPAVLSDVAIPGGLTDNGNGTWGFQDDGTNGAFYMPAAGSYQVLAPGAFTFTATTPAGGVDVTCNSVGAPGSYGTTVNVVKNDATVKGSSNTPVKHGAKAVLKAKVTSPVTRKPTGTVTFKQGAKKLGTASLKKGVATLSLKLSKGTHKIKALYAGDGYTNAGTSAVFKVVQK